jgi:hypothetical protein
MYVNSIITVPEQYNMKTLPRERVTFRSRNLLRKYSSIEDKNIAS